LVLLAIRLLLETLPFKETPITLPLPYAGRIARFSRAQA